jgi:histidinol-phosphate aminotransferase
MLEKTRDSYNVDAIAQTLALAAINDQTWARSNWQTIRDDRDKLRAELQTSGFSVPLSETNFLLAQSSSVHRADAASLYSSLRTQNILVRYFTELPDRLRISVGTPAENNRLIAALDTLLDH